MNQAPSFEKLRKRLYHDWCVEQMSREGAPPESFDRGSMSLAMLLRNVEDTASHGTRSFIANDNVSWAVMRDVPPGHFPGVNSIHLAGASYLSTGSAELHFGMPRISFNGKRSHHIHFNKQSHPRSVMEPFLIREFEIYTRMSASMTRLAFHGRMKNGDPVRRSWFRARDRKVKSERVVPAAEWMPKPVLVFSRANVESLYIAATETRGNGHTSACPHCSTQFELTEFKDVAKFSTRFIDNGNWVAICPTCGKRGYYYLDEVEYSTARRKFSGFFKTEFCAAVCRGLPIVAPADWTYVGSTIQSQQRLEMCTSYPRMDVLPHTFKCHATGTNETIYLPYGVPVEHRIGTTIDAGDVIAHLLHKPGREWQALPVPEQWQNLAPVCGGSVWVGFMQKLWFFSKGVRLHGHPDKVFYSADLASPAAYSFRPLDLWWDVTESEPYMQGTLEAAVFPPVPLARWDKLKLTLPGDVLLDARIVHPCFTASCDRSVFDRIYGHKAMPVSPLVNVKPVARPINKAGRSAVKKFRWIKGKPVGRQDSRVNQVNIAV